MPSPRKSLIVSFITFRPRKIPPRRNHGIRSLPRHVRLFTATFIKRTGLAFAVLAAVWLVIVAWQGFEHNRVKKASRTPLLNRSQDITTTLGLVIRSQRRFGSIVSQERLEPALTELVKSGELEAVALVNASGEVVASAGTPIELESKHMMQTG